MRTERNIVLFALLLIALVSAQTQSTPRFLQETQRSPGAIKMCANFVGKKLQSLVDANTIAQAQANKKAFQTSLSVSGNQIIGGLLKDFGSAGTALPTIVTPLATFIGPSVLGLVILVLIWPFLCCCCCCPSCCPSKCCQKPENQQYTKCELIWPTVVMIAALLIVTFAGCAALTKATDLQGSYQSVGCALTIAFDDILYGNTSSVGTYFMGIGTLIRGLNDLKNNPNALKTQFNKIRILNVTAPLATTYWAGKDLINLFRKLPKGTENVTADPWNYNNFDTTVATIASNFSTVLGKTGATASGLLGTQQLYVYNKNQKLYTWGLISEGLFRQADNLGSTIDPAVSGMKDILTMLQNFPNVIADDTISGMVKNVSLGLGIVFGVALSLAMVGIIAALFYTFNQKYGCRKLGYCVCVILFILGLLCFILALLFSIISPVLYLTCDFLTVTISSGAGFTQNVGSLLGSTADLVTSCLPGGNGDIIGSLPGNVQAVTNLTDLIKGIRDYDSTVERGLMQGAIDRLSTVIDQHYYTDVYDFTSPSNQAILTKIANPADAAYSACTVNNFQNDKWVPSLRNSKFSCGTITKNASATQCPNSAKIQLGKGAGATPASQCYGCIDSNKVLYNAAQADVSVDLNARYTGGHANCATWATNVKNAYNQYYKIKKTNIDPIRTRMTTINDSYHTPTNGYRARIGTLPAIFTEVTLNLEQSIPRIFHRKYGLGDGLNCLVIGDDLKLVADTVCTSLYNTIFGLRLPLLFLGFGILFAMCCTTCSGVRAYKQQIRKGYIGVKEQPSKRH